MEVEYRVNSDHLSWDDLGLSAAVDKYTSPFWPFGRRARAREKLKEEQEKILDKHDIEKETHMGITTLKVNSIQSEDEAEKKMERLKSDVEDFYQEEFGVDEPFEYTQRERARV